MKRVAFKMYLKPGQKDAYIKRHDEIWPELQELLKKSGIAEYSIFLDEESSTLFAFQKIEGEKDSQDLGKHEIMQKWWDYMADLMKVNADNSPVSDEMEEVFYLK